MSNEYVWLNDLSQQFLEQDYLLPGQTVDERVDIICDKFAELYGDKEVAARFKSYFQKGWYSFSTPVWTNYGTERGLPISCFGTHIEDRMESILHGVAEVGMQTKNGGGTSAYFGDLRGRGSEIKNNGNSHGSVHFMGLFDSLLKVISQGSTRRGNMAVYLPAEHPDIMEFLSIRSEGSPIQDLSYGVSVSDYFMNQMIAGDMRFRKTWAKVLESRAKKGYPYIFWTGNANGETKPSCYHDLTITHSNLCSEISLPDGPDESFVCCLSSMNILHYDEWKNSDAVELMIYFLDTVMEEFIDKAKFIPFMERAVKFAVGHRALGLGWLGYHSYLQAKMIPFESFEAKMLNIEIAKLIQKKSYMASEYLAKKFGEPSMLRGAGRRNTTLCVAGNTYLLTDRGVRSIEQTVDQQLNVWNGLEFSPVTPFYTGESELLRITLSNGTTLDCTPDHKFLVATPQVNSLLFGKNVSIEVPANKLREGDCMPKHLFPVIDHGLDLPHAYTNGAFAGDGSISNTRDGKYPRNELRLYGKKMAMASRVEWKHSAHYVAQTGKTPECYRGYLPDNFLPKTTVPINYSLKSRLEWLAGLIDTDGSAGSKGISISMASHKFAKDVLTLTQTLGINATLGQNTRKGGYSSNNDIYYVIGISMQGCTILSELGMVTSRVALKKSKLGLGTCPCNHYITVKSIEKLQGIHKTYCFTDPIRGTGVFNGVYTKQCAIAPTKSSAFILGQVSEGIEPHRSNYMIKDLAKGKFSIKNHHLEALLESKGHNTPEVWDSILKRSGSVQHLDILTDEEKKVFKTFQEISPREIIIQAAARQQFIDQGQSLNLMISPNTSAKDVNTLFIEAWRLGLKGLYYQYSVNAAQEAARDILSCESCSA